MVKTLADCIQNRVWAGQNDAMKTSAKNERGQGAAFTLLERATDQATRIAAALASEEEELQRWAQTLKRNCE